MYSMRCPSCSQPITLKNEEIIAAIAESEAAKHVTYNMACPKCRKPVKIPVKQLKLKVQRPKPAEGEA